MINAKDSKDTFYILNNKQDTPVVLIHGVGLNHKIWEPQINSFNNTVLAYDILGHGNTPLTKSQISFDDFSLQLLNLIDELTEIKKTISLGGVAECLGVSCLRKKDTDEGEMDLLIHAGIRNTSDSYIPRAQLSVKAMDQRDAQIDDCVDYEVLPAKSSHTFSPSFWGLKPKKMKNGVLSISASVFLPIESFSLEAEPTPYSG